MAEMIDDTKLPFYTLMSLYEDITVKPTKQNTLALKNILQKSPRQALQPLPCDLLFNLNLFNLIEPILYEKSPSVEIKRNLIDILKILLSSGRVVKSELFVRVFQVIFYQLKGPQKFSVASVPEELKLSVVQCVKLLFLSGTSDVVEQFYNTENYDKIAWGITFCKNLAELERMITLRVESLECILYIIQCNDEADKTDIVLRDKVKQFVKGVLPGVVSVCANVCRDVLEHHRIVQIGIRVWHRVIFLLLEEREIWETEQEQSLVFWYSQFLKSNIDRKSNDDSKMPVEEKNVITEEWLKMAAVQLVGVSELIVNCQQHSHQYVRKELCIAVFKILSHCSRTMQPSLRCLIECLIVLSQDECEEVAMCSVAALSKFSFRFKSDSEKSFFENIEDCFFSFLTKFPRNMLSADMKSQMNLLSGYLHLLDSCLPQFLSSRCHLDRLIFCLIHIVKIDVSAISLLADPSIRDMEDRKMHNCHWKKMILSHGDETLIYLDKICSVLRRYDNISIIVHSLLDSVYENQLYINEILLILNVLITGGPIGAMADHADLAEEVFNFYLDRPIWPASEILMSEDGGIRNDQIRVIQLCLAVEGVGNMAKAVGKDIFSPWLLKSLFAVLEAAGSPLEIVAVAGLEAIQNIAWECSGDNLTTLICNNTDYLTHHITRRLHHYHRHPGLLAVLSVIMRYSSVEVLPSLQEIISDILKQSYHSFQMNNIYAYLRTFFTFLCSVRKWTEEDATVAVTTLPDEEANKKSPLELLIDYRKSKDIVENMNSDSDDDEVNLEEKFAKCCVVPRSEEIADGDLEMDVSSKKDVPIQIQLVVDILERSLHFLPSKDPYQKILVLEVLQEGILLLKPYQDRLLPVVHLIWSPLVSRFKVESNEPLIMHRSFLLLQALASTSKDFIKMRTLRDVIPSICRFLKEKAVESERKDTKSGYRVTQQYKLQKCLLEGIGQLAVDAQFAEINVNEIIKAASPYLSSLQPQPLQIACVNSFKMLAKKSADLLWLHLITIWSPSAVLKPPCSSFPSVQLSHSCNSEFDKNIQILIDTLESR